MQVTSVQFKSRASANLDNPQLQRALGKFKESFVGGRARAVAAMPEFDAMRDAARDIRQRVLERLDAWLEEFEARATARGARVHWAATPEAAARIVCDIARENGVRKAVKSKSMVSEECALNEALEAAGVEVVETDLGEYIIQLAKEPPSHIIAPVVHKTREEIADLFAEKHGAPRKTQIAELCREAREVLRPHFLTADMGLSGANFLVAETGSTLIVTNEGNGRMVTTLPRVHVVLVGIEKVVPTLDDVATLLRVLTRSATGQPISNYVSVTTGPRGEGDLDGPEQFHVVLLDGGRTGLLAGELKQALRCIRCGACANHCPVYQAVGGHAWGWVYSGPIGTVLTPAFAGLERTADLPHASTLCNQCGVVCPVRIPLPDLQRRLRERQVEAGIRPRRERAALRLWAWASRRPVLYAAGARIAARFLAMLGADDGLIHRLPFAGGWTQGRDMPAPPGATFRDLHRLSRLGKH